MTGGNGAQFGTDANIRGGMGGTTTAGGAHGLWVNRPATTNQPVAANNGSAGRGGSGVLDTVNAFSSGGGGSGHLSSIIVNGIFNSGNQLMPNHVGGTMTGNAGHGFARITRL